MAMLYTDIQLRVKCEQYYGKALRKAVDIIRSGDYANKGLAELEVKLTEVEQHAKDYSVESAKAFGPTEPPK